MEAALDLSHLDEASIEGLPRPDRVRLAEALRQRLGREAKARFLSYARYVRPDYRVAPHLELIAGKLEAIERGEIDRSMIFAAPRHGKSLTSSILFPAWYLGKHPQKQIIAAAYGEQLVAGFGARIRNIMGGDEHRSIFGAAGSLAQEAQARDHFLTKAGGVYRAAGVGGAITGFGAHILLIDDPIRGREDAESAVIRNKVWDWWQNDAYTRLMPGGAVIVIQTRWHEDDLAGRLLDQSHGDWDVLHLPALDGEDRACWPEMFDEKALARIRDDVGARTWQALYQGDPVPDTGDFFQAEWFREGTRYYGPEDAAKGLIRVYAASDYAVTGGAGDYTVHVIVGIDPDDNLHILDIWRKRVTPDVWADAMLDLAERWKPLMWAEGKGGLQRAAEPYIRKRQMERRIYFARMQIGETQDKRERAQAFQGRMASGKVFWPYRAPWFAEAQSELIKFDAGRHDDIVDALSLIGKMLAGMAPGRVPPSPRGPEAQLVIQADGAGLAEGTPMVTWNDVIARTKKMRRRRAYA